MSAKIKIIFAGSGSAFTMDENNFHSNVIIETTDSAYNLLFDCGSDARWSLANLGRSYKDIQSVYISHLHADHIGGLEWLGFSSFFDETCVKPELILSKDLVDDLWEHSLSGGMLSLEDQQASLALFFNVKPVESEKGFTWQGIDFELIKMRHVISEGNLVPCYGLFFEVNNQRIFYTADTQFNLDLVPLYEKADIIFHDCETGLNKSRVHAHFDELCTLPNHIKNKMWLYHYGSGKRKDPVKNGFKGYVLPGQTFIF